ncbi:MAG: Uma2 family endonuclease [Clostridiales bacterium]|jgi:Uma2 family endonuclease|nr:Uma2 family endonuclease [Clostridiales bacterium]
MEAVKRQIHYTYDDYVKWDTSERYELIEGTAYMMSAPSIAHQSISLELSRQFGNFLRGKPCRVFAAPFDVRLNYDSGDDTCVQPDITIVCDHAKLSDGKSCNGAPDMIVEIISPSTASLDWFKKTRLYQKAGVGEYWIVDPEIKAVFVNILEDGQYQPREYTVSDSASLPVRALPGFRVQLDELFTP